MKYSIVVPCYNEEKNIESLILAFAGLCLDPASFELILVQNGSTDGTASELERCTKGLMWAHVVEIPINEGYGYGIKQGLKVADGDFLGWMHADLQFSPSEIVRAVDAQRALGVEHNLLLKGVRRNRPISDRFFTAGMACFESILLGCRMYDINAQPTIFSRDIYDLWGDKAPNDFSIDLFAYNLALKNQCQLYRWPVQQHARTGGKSSWNTGMSARWKLIRRTVSYSVGLRRTLRGRNSLK